MLVLIEIKTKNRPMSFTHQKQNRMIYLVDQDKIRRHNTFIRIHLDYPCFTEGCEGTGNKGLRVQQPPRRLDTEASSKGKR